MYKSRDKLSPSCSSSEDLVAYLYDEMNAAARPAFEDHLSACDACTGEFAELSLARLGVYEWHRDEFASLATPRVVIPYHEPIKVSWLDGVRAFFASHASMAAAGGAFAIVAVVAGVFYVSTLRDAEVVYVEPITPQVEKAAAGPTPAVDRRPAPSASSDIVDAEEDVEKPSVVKASSASDAPKPVRAKSVSPAVRRPAPNQPVQTRRTAPAPRLNDFDDEDDNTLRLGDLLAEVETRDD